MSIISNKLSEQLRKRKMKTNEQFEVREHMLKEKCIICKKYFKLKEKIILCPIQEPAGDYFINAIAIPLHTHCFFKEQK